LRVYYYNSLIPYINKCRRTNWKASVVCLDIIGAATRGKNMPRQRHSDYGGSGGGGSHKEQRINIRNGENTTIGRDKQLSSYSILNFWVFWVLVLLIIVLLYFLFF
jgi:hypothetical protein